MGNAGGSKDVGDSFEGGAEVSSLVVDEVPLGLRCWSSHIVRSHLCLVKLPLEHKQRTWEKAGVKKSLSRAGEHLLFIVG